MTAKSQHQLHAQCRLRAEPLPAHDAGSGAPHRLPVENIIFETIEDERVHDASYVKKIFATYRREGFKTAIDDFGAGYAGLNLLADFQPDL